VCRYTGRGGSGGSLAGGGTDRWAPGALDHFERREIKTTLEHLATYFELTQGRITVNNYIESGDSLALTAPYDVLSGGGFQVGVMFCVAAGDAISGAAVEGATEGVYDLAKDSSVFAQGARVYWDNSAKACTSTVGSNVVVGVAVVAALTGNASVRVRLNGAF